MQSIKIAVFCVAVSAWVAHAAAAPDEIIFGVPMDYQAGKPLSDAYHQGQADLVTLLNRRGGVEGHAIRLLDGDHANNAAKGLALYDQMRDAGALAIDPLSTIVAQSVMGKASEDHVNLMTFYSGRSDAADGTVFPWVFPASPTYWSEAAAVVAFIASKTRGRLRGETIGFLSTENETGLGKASLPFVQELARRQGFTLVTGFYPRGGDPAPVLAEYLRARPDWTMLWDGGAGKVSVVKYLLEHDVPARRITSLVWLSEADMKQIGTGGAHIARFEGVAAGRASPTIAAIMHEVVTTGLGSGPANNVGTTFYNIGVASIAIEAEAARWAIKHAHAGLSRDGFNEGLRHIRNFTAGGLLPPMTLTAADHQGGGAGRMVEWTGTEWHPVTPWGSWSQDLVWRMIRRSAAAYNAR